MRTLVKFIILFSAFSILIINVNADPKTVCQQGCDFSSISDALAVANDGDIIEIIYEAPPVCYSYDEHIIINKPITLTSDGTGDNLPIITQDLTGTPDEVIKIEVTASENNPYNVTISNLKIESSQAIPEATPTATPDSVNMTTDAGIKISYLENTNCIIEDCLITKCRTGILINNTGDPDRWTRVDRCRIGLPVDDPWTYTNPPHPGNFFGIVQIEPARSVDPTPVPGNYSGDLIRDCYIARNRFYGIVVRGGSQCTIQNNLIVWNGTDTPITDSDDNYGDGGVLSLFTGNERSNTEVYMQAPWILNNNIYGNLGFQIAVVTKELEAPYEIVNNPVVMSNIIGPDPWIDPGLPEHERPFLISCTSESPSAASTPENGSGVYLAFNNIYRVVTPKQSTRYFAHPHNPTPTPDSSWTATPFPYTVTPTFTATQPPLITPTQTPYFEYTRVPGASPTYPTRTPTPACTPTPKDPHGSYNLDNTKWSSYNVYSDPKFVGLQNTATPLAYFDFHLKDPIFQLTPTPIDERSSCFETGGFNLNPGPTTADGEPDIGYVDMGRHFPSQVPPVTHLNCQHVSGTPHFITTWNNPDHREDGSLFDDLAGNIVFLIKYQPNQFPEYLIVQQQYLDPSESYEFDIIQIPRPYDYVGVTVFDVMGARSEMMLVKIPK